MALTPDVAVVVPGELITAAHLNNIRANLDRLTNDKAQLTGADFTGSVLVGGNPAGNAAGFITRPDGVQIGRVNPTATTQSSLRLERSGANAGAGSLFVAFARGAIVGGGVVDVGSITVNPGGNGVVYNQSSDARLKHRDGPVVDALDRAVALGRAVFRGRWLNLDTGEPVAEERDMLTAEAIADGGADYVVTGEPDAVDDAGNAIYQQVDYSSLVPLLLAAVAELTDRVAELEAVR